MCDWLMIDVGYVPVFPAPDTEESKDSSAQGLSPAAMSAGSPVQSPATPQTPADRTGWDRLGSKKRGVLGATLSACTPWLHVTSLGTDAPVVLRGCCVGVAWGLWGSEVLAVGVRVCVWGGGGRALRGIAEQCWV